MERFKRGRNPQFNAKAINRCIDMFHPAFEFDKFACQFVNINVLLRFKCINISRNVQVEIILRNFLETGTPAVFGFFNPVPVGVNYFADVIIPQDILGLHLIKMLAGINKQDIFGVLATLFKHQDARWYTGPIKDICR